MRTLALVIVFLVCSLHDPLSAASRCTEVVGSAADLVGIVLFEEGSSKVSVQMSTSLRGVASVLKAESLGINNKLYLVGFTDREGSPTENITVSEERAHNVLKFLFGLLPDTLKMEAVGCGENYPVIPKSGTNPHNRRVEIRLE